MARMVRSATGAPGGGQYPSYDSTSPSAFTPQIWSALMTVELFPATCVGDFANTDYSKEIQGFGDSVVIRMSAKITISDHEVGEDIWDKYEVPTSNTQVLEINKSKMFATQIDSIDELQSDIALQKDFTENAGQAMASEIDESILIDIQDDAAPENKGNGAGVKSGDIVLGTPAAGRAVSTANAVDYMLDLALTLDEQNVPRENRFAVVPMRLLQRLKNSPLRDASLTGDATSPLRNGKVGMFDDFMLYGSNLLPVNGGVFNVIAGHRMALTFASQVDQHTLEVLPNPRKFGKLMRGMTLYGHETVKPEALVNSFVTIT